MVKASTIKSSPQSMSPLQAFLIHLACVIGLVVGFWVAHYFYFINLVSDPLHTLRLIWYLKAVGRGILGLPIGALVNAMGAIALGAPLGTQYLPKTINWSLLMSLFTFVPAASVFGSSWADWQRIFAHTKPYGSLEYMICLPAHGAVIGAWVGAWPMPLDWEKPWQEWPICVTFGAMAGYFLGVMASLGLVLARGKQEHRKGD